MQARINKRFTCYDIADTFDPENAIAGKVWKVDETAEYFIKTVQKIYPGKEIVYNYLNNPILPVDTKGILQIAVIENNIAKAVLTFEKMS